MKFVLLSCVIATALAHPQRPFRAGFNNQFLDQEPPCPCGLRQQAYVGDNFGFPGADAFGDPFQRNARSAVADMTPDFYTLVRTTIEPAQIATPDAQLRKVRSTDSWMSAYEPQDFQDVGQARLPIDLASYSLPAVAAEYEDTHARRARAAGPGTPFVLDGSQLQIMLDGAHLAARKERSEEVTPNQSRRGFESAEAPVPSFGMYYMRVESFNAVNNADDNTKKAVAEAQPEDAKPTEQSAKDKEDVSDTLQQLMMGQLAIMTQQQQMEQWNREVSQQYQAELEQILRQIELVKSKGAVSGTKVPEIKSSNAGSTTGSTTVPSTETTTTGQPTVPRV